MKRKSNFAKRPAQKRRRINKKASLKTRVNKIYRFIKNNRPEVKKAIYSVNAVPLADGVTLTYNLMYHAMQQGTNEFSFTGKSINLKGVSVKIRQTNEAIGTGAASGFSPCHQRAIYSLIGHKDYYTTSSIPVAQINATEYGTFNTFSPHYDAEKVKIYKQKVLDLKSDSPGVDVNNNPYVLGAYPRMATSTMYYKTNRKITFERWSSDYKIKGPQLYFMVQTNALQQIAYANYGVVTFDVTLYYTDD